MELVAPRDGLAAMRDAFRAYFLERTTDARRLPVPLPEPAPRGANAMILVPGLIPGIPAYTVKVHAKHPGCDPAIQGVIVLHDLATGVPLAILESTYLTAVRTGLAGALGAEILSRTGAHTAAIIGAGVQGALQLETLCLVRPITTVHVFDILPGKAEEFARCHGSRLNLNILPVSDLHSALHSADVVVTSTWATEPFLYPDMVAPGTHITTLGPDQPGKAEVSADLLRSSLVICDDRQLAAEMGVAGGVGLGPEAVHAELGEVIAGCHPGRTSPDQISVFGSVGLAFQDLAVAWLTYQRAQEHGVGHRLDLMK